MENGKDRILLIDYLPKCKQVCRSSRFQQGDIVWFSRDFMTGLNFSSVGSRYTLSFNDTDEYGRRIRP